MHGVASSKTAHVQEMVARQNTAKRRGGGGGRGGGRGGGGGFGRGGSGGRGGGGGGRYRPTVQYDWSDPEEDFARWRQVEEVEEEGGGTSFGPQAVGGRGAPPPSSLHGLTLGGRGRARARAPQPPLGGVLARHWWHHSPGPAGLQSPAPPRPPAPVAKEARQGPGWAPVPKAEVAVTEGGAGVWGPRVEEVLRGKVHGLFVTQVY